MAITNPTTALRLERIVTGSDSNTWGDRLNANWARVDAALGAGTVDISSGNVTLTSTDSGDTNADAQTRPTVIIITGSTGFSRTVTWPSGTGQRVYYVRNQSNTSVTCTVSGGSGVALAAGEYAELYYSNTTFSRAAVPSQSLASPGNTVLPGGMIMQWGTATSDGSGAASVSLSYPQTTMLDFQVTLLTSGLYQASFGAKKNSESSLTIYVCNSSSGTALSGVSFNWRTLGV